MERELLNKWIKILRLQDFDIKLELKTIEEMSIEETDEIHMGNVVVDLEHNKAFIRLLNQEGFNKMKKEEQNFKEIVDMEFTVVHELLHIYFAGADSYTDLYIEQRINHLAELLIRLHKE